ncbi:MAG: hypothetical protein CM1200mP16_09230 [Nitrospina sp.]|nr:MAG: hypothetical protein CM1200mP16_09230 [Nitrospina sp.]
MIKNQAEEIRAYLLDKISVHPKNIVAKAAKAFACSRTTVHRHLNRLLRDGQIIKSGTTRQIQYFLKTEKNKEVIISLKNKVEEHKVWQKKFSKKILRCFLKMFVIFVNTVFWKSLIMLSIILRELR